MAHSSQVLVGRDPELASLVSLLGVTSAPRPDAICHVLLSGDAGVGKTRLLAELSARAESEGWQVYVGHSLDFGDSAIAYLPFSEVLGRMVDALPGVVDEAVSAYPALARLQPVRRGLGGERDERADVAGVDRVDLFDGVRILLESAAQKAPVLLVMEDTHWADQSTRDLLTFLFTRSFSGPVAVVASYRSDDLHRRHPLRRQVAEWMRLPGVERLALSPLSDDAVRSLVGELAANMGEPQREAIVARAEGNAFFVEELVGAACVSGVPDDLADLLLVRLDRLDEQTREMVRTASVAGRRVSHELLEAVTGLDAGALDDALRRAVEMNILVPSEGRYSFRHALLGEAVYDDLLPGERVRLHAHYAAALQEVPGRGTAAELARHARRAHDLPVAVTASIQAGDEAMGVGGPDEAADHYQVALALAADPATRAQVAIDAPGLAVKAADALTIAGYPSRAAKLIAEQIGQLPDDSPTSARARMLMSRAEALSVMESGTESLDLSAEAVALVPDDAPVARAKVLASRARILSAYGRIEEAQAVGMDALALAERHDLHHVAAEAVTTLSGLRKRGPKDAFRQALREAIARAEASHSLRAELRGRFFLGRSYEDEAEFDESEQWFASAMERADEAGIPWAPYAADARWHVVWTHYLLGRWDRALEALRPGARAPQLMRAVGDTIKLAIKQARGADVLREARALRRMWADEGLIAIHSAPLEMTEAVRRSDAAAVLAAYDDVVAAMTRIWHPWFSARIRLGALAIGGLADLLPEVPAAERAALVARAEEIHADGHTVMAQLSEPTGEWGPEGRAWLQRLDAEWERVRWLTDTDAPSQDELVASWLECERAFEQFGHVYELACTRAALATILRAVGDLTASREAADRARDTARSLGAQPMLDQLRSLGASPVRAPIDPGALTPREREIIALVAAGRSNGEIARQLFISTKTVSVHVSNILGKLGAAGRTEAAAIARRRGLVDAG